MKKTNNKSVNKALDDVRKAVLDIDKKKNTKSRVKKVKSKPDDVLLLTDVYELDNIVSDSKKEDVFKTNVKNLVQKDIKKWLENNFNLIALDYTKDAIKSLNNKNY